MIRQLLQSFFLLRLSLLSEAVGQGNPTLYCVALITPGTTELQLLAGQFQLKAGLFECDDFAIVSNISGAELFTDSAELLKWVAPKVYKMNIPLESKMVRGPPGFDPSSPKEVGKKSVQHLANTPVFLHFWKTLGALQDYKKYDYTVKVDADTVLLPSRLSRLLAGRQSAEPEYFFNTNHDMYGNFLHGPIELVSKSAMQVYQSGGKECEEKISKLAYGEDFWMNTCLGRLGVKAVAGLPLMYDMYSYGPYAQKKCSPLIPEHPELPQNKPMEFVAYHPYKKFEDWMNCRVQTGEGPPISAGLRQQAMTQAQHFSLAFSRPSRLFGVFGEVEVAQAQHSWMGIAAVPLAMCFMLVSGMFLAVHCHRSSTFSVKAVPADVENQGELSAHLQACEARCLMNIDRHEDVSLTF